MTHETGRDMDDQSFAVILGATSLVGRHLAKRLSDRKARGLCLSRHVESITYEAPPGFSWHIVSEEDKMQIPNSATLFSLIPVSTLPSFLMRINGGGRLIALSTSSLLFGEQSSNREERCSAQAQVRAEERVLALCRQREMIWTMFRPTLIYDPGHDRNISKIAVFVRRFGFFPVVWPGAGLRQPIHADDVAQVMVAASISPRVCNKLFDLPGPETLTYSEMVRMICLSLEKRPMLIYLPLSVARVAFYLWQALTGEKYSSASLERMNKALTLNPAPVRDTLGLTTRPFRPEFPENL